VDEKSVLEFLLPLTLEKSDKLWYSFYTKNFDASKGLSLL